jgi:serine/threonine-protein kinase
MSDVFVSYKAEDRRRVKPLVEALEAEGYSVWWDEQIGGGARWRHAIEAELNTAKCVIVAWSKRSVSEEGTFVQDEATRAQQRHVYVPVLIDKVHLPLGFGETQALPLTGWKDNRSDPRFQAILAAVARLAGASSREQRGQSAPPRLSRRAVVAGGGIAAVAIAGVGGYALFKPGSASAAGIAVLPFANLSGDPGQNYFSDGIAEELRSALARLAGLQVVGRTSSEAVRNDDAQTAARKLGVANILTGSVRQSPSTIRVGAQLIDGRNGIERWSETYDRKPGDVIMIQTDIAENVATSLSAALGSAARSVVELGGTANAAAQQLYLQGRGAAADFSKDGLLQAITLTDAAIQLDPNYAAAYAAKGAFENLYANNFVSSVQELDRYRARALQSARTALKIAPNFAGGHRTIGGIYQFQLRIADALREFSRALQLAPSDSNTMLVYAFC